MSCQVYRHFDARGRLLYIGVSLCALERLRGHKESHSPWFDKIKKVTIERFANRKKAQKAEKQAIKYEKPRFNVNNSTFNLCITPKGMSYRCWLKAQAKKRKQIRNLRECARRYRISMVRLFKRFLREGTSQAQIARTFNITRQRVHQIVTGK